MIDEFCAIGHPLHELPESCMAIRKVTGLQTRRYWCMGRSPFRIDASSPEADLSGKIGFNVFRGLSLPPDDAHGDRPNRHSLVPFQIGDFVMAFAANSIATKEVVATRVSAANAFYCTSGHAAMRSTSSSNQK